MGEAGTLAHLTQAIATTPGQLYLFSSWVNSPDGEAPNQCSVSWNGTTLFNQVNIPTLGWTNLQYLVTAIGSGTTIQFGFRDDSSYLGLDDVSVIPVNAPVFQSAAKSGGSINMTWSATSGLVYQLQYTTNLTSGAWNNIGSPINATGGTANGTDATPSGPVRFYRLIMLP